MEKQQEIVRIIDQINRLYTGHCWLGYNIAQILEGINADAANRGILGCPNTIHQIVRHILFTEQIIMERLNGIDSVTDTAVDWMPSKVETQSIPWEETVSQLYQSKDKLVMQLEALHDAVLDRPIIKDYSTIYVTLHGHIQHTAYHFGQVMLLKRLVG